MEPRKKSSKNAIGEKKIEPINNDKELVSIFLNHIETFAISNGLITENDKRIFTSNKKSYPTEALDVLITSISYNIETLYEELKRNQKSQLNSTNLRVRQNQNNKNQKINLLIAFKKMLTYFQRSINSIKPDNSIHHNQKNIIINMLAAIKTISNSSTYSEVTKKTMSPLLDYCYGIIENTLRNKDDEGLPIYDYDEIHNQATDLMYTQILDEEINRYNIFSDPDSIKPDPMEEDEEFILQNQISAETTEVKIEKKEKNEPISQKTSEKQDKKTASSEENKKTIAQAKIEISAIPRNPSDSITEHNYYEAGQPDLNYIESLEFLFSHYRRYLEYIDHLKTLPEKGSDLINNIYDEYMCVIFSEEYYKLPKDLKPEFSTFARERFDLIEDAQKAKIKSMLENKISQLAQWHNEYPKLISTAKELVSTLRNIRERLENEDIEAKITKEEYSTIKTQFAIIVEINKGNEIQLSTPISNYRPHSTKTKKEKKGEKNNNEYFTKEEQASENTKVIECAENILNRLKPKTLTASSTSNIFAKLPETSSNKLSNPLHNFSGDEKKITQEIVSKDKFSHNRIHPDIKLLLFDACKRYQEHLSIAISNSSKDLPKKNNILGLLTKCMEALNVDSAAGFYEYYNLICDATKYNSLIDFNAQKNIFKTTVHAILGLESQKNISNSISNFEKYLKSKKSSLIKKCKSKSNALDWKTICNELKNVPDAHKSAQLYAELDSKLNLAKNNQKLLTPPECLSYNLEKRLKTLQDLLNTFDQMGGLVSDYERGNIAAAFGSEKRTLVAGLQQAASTYLSNLTGGQQEEKIQFSSNSLSHTTTNKR